MAKIQMRRTKTAGQKPTAAQILEGELIINLPDRKIYTKNDAGGIIELGNPETADKLTVAGTLEAGGATTLNGGATIANKTNITGATAELTIGSGTATPTIKMGVTASKSHQIKGNGNDLEITADRVNITSGKIALNPLAGGEIQGKGGNKILSDDGNGNVIVSGGKNGTTTGDLELGGTANGHSTKNIKLRSPLVNASNETLVDANGKIKASMLDMGYTTPADVATDYYSKTQADGKYLTKTDATTNHYTKTQTDSAFLKKTDATATYYSKNEADSRFISTAGNLHSEGYILSNAVDGTASTSDTSMKYSGFYRMNQAANALNNLNIHVANPLVKTASDARGIAFEAGSVGNKAYVYRYGSDGKFIKSAKIYTEDDKPTLAELGGGVLGGSVTSDYDITTMKTVKSNQVDSTYRMSIQRADAQYSPYFRLIKTDVISSVSLPAANISIGNIGFQEGSTNADPYGGVIRGNVSTTVTTTGGAVLYIDARDSGGVVKNRITLDTDTATTSIATGSFKAGTTTLGTTTTGTLTSTGTIVAGNQLTAKSKLILNSESTTTNGIEIGSLTNATSPYIDFHTDGLAATDYNVRIQASTGKLAVIGGNQNIEIDAKTTTVLNMHDSASSMIKMARGAVVLRDFNNGNVTLCGGLKPDGTAGDLYLGYNSTSANAYTNTVRLDSPLTWQGKSNLVDANGKLVGASLDTSYLPLTGGSLSGPLTVSGIATLNGNTVAKAVSATSLTVSGTSTFAGNVTTNGSVITKGITATGAISATTNLVSTGGSLESWNDGNSHVWFRQSNGTEKALIWAGSDNVLRMRTAAKSVSLEDSSLVLSGTINSGAISSSGNINAASFTTPGAINANGTISSGVISSGGLTKFTSGQILGQNNAKLFADHGNGNVTLSASLTSNSASSGTLIIGYDARASGFYTDRIQLMMPVTANSTIAAAGRVSGGDLLSSGVVYAGGGTAYLNTDGNITGSVWGGGWLSTHIENRAYAHANERAQAWANQQVNAYLYSQDAWYPGSYAMARYAGANLGIGGVVAGSGLNPATCDGAYDISTTLPGTWMCMGRSLTNNDAHRTTIWKRVG
ncbi:hypothetical protein [Atlantibacter hermannii]|uniref:Uncharacterized protein n=1 Tax=Atlantibacter hermannii NBRC 105704 TaxID=1115512 RepID=H5V1Z2_ATLHE|nr:hypothetical protein [Atlantibacter hermannii]QPS93805.1 hypothetical protein I6G45_10110 [Atlantibacter hermannii]GAB52000.1 hypothetical protein EH105704_05_00060 [Atlantibacter hermannii NBRC 105704]VDZ73277.1 Uncharacterised protein [Atlantibacter hermannii]